MAIPPGQLVNPAGAELHVKLHGGRHVQAYAERHIQLYIDNVRQAGPRMLRGMRRRPPIWTIGHSTHDAAKFVALVADGQIEVVADVRSQPFSRFNAQFTREPLRKSLHAAGIRYVFLGNELGGRPPEPEFYDSEGHVLYGAVSETERFNTGLARLVEGASQFRVAMMCSEEDPTHCHRRLLITRVLVGQGIEVRHIRGDGSEILEADLAVERDPVQAPLFGEEALSWRSTQSVLRNTARRAFSKS